MTERIKELLAVLDMPEGSPEQYGWLLSTIREHKACCPADLSFRLRDEVLSSENGMRQWICGMFDVYMKATKNKLLNWKWGYVKAKPIHWIIAALIAKEMK